MEYLYYLYNNIDVIRDWVNLAFIAIPTVMAIFAIYSAMEHGKQYNEMNSSKKRGAAAVKNKYMKEKFKAGKIYLIAISCLCVYIVVVRIQYQLAEKKIQQLESSYKTDVEEAIKVEKRLLKMELQAIKSENEKLKTQLKKSQK
ncbi:hypothetical protein [Candidatus Uabimicrobium amorphum]|uniref:Uncharacterized protein n=1 Tax=Uabimicrobium amorphum TaxID=2596890 RepID=A0A5S9F5A2_UABAM|nr:hypothetical protein [Candidatus Uabimicrobium amorphum]BBM86647.1 hypothetical protein UABAM_05033 [Candidatus Uabimicrobium amorphum]